MKIVLLIAILILSLFILETAGFGNSIFFANVLLTNKAYGSGAVFNCNVWYNANLQQMRVDYYSINGTQFMSVYYNYATKDQYQICGPTCSRATWASPMPIFAGSISTYASTSCEVSDWPGPSSCVSGCTSYLSSPNQPQGLYSLSYNDTGSTILCLARFTPASGQTYGPEWHIINYKTSAFASGFNPTDASSFTVPNVASCPSPTCFAVLDIAFVIDQSGSISDASYIYLQDFINQIISALTFSTDKVRAGLVYFSGQSCNNNQTSSLGSYSGCGGSCTTCGGRWNNLTPGGVLSSKSQLVDLVKTHIQDKGATCISCGVDVGTQILNVNPKANVQKVIILMTDGMQNCVTGSLSKVAKIAYDQQIITYAIGIANFKMADLLTITTQDRIFNSSTFSLLSTILPSIITPLCQPLPSIDTCNFCSGLCSCTTTCNCPNCNDYNACTVDNCDIRPPPLGTQGACTYTTFPCEDNDICTQNLCNNQTGCYYPAAVKAQNQVDTYCKAYVCTNPQGFQITDVGTAKCTSTNLCQIKYCNSTVGTTGGLTGSCVTVDKSTLTSGTSVSFVNSAGQTITVAGCAKPAGTPTCSVYSCATDGTCQVDNSACVCLTSADCNDHNGCTTDSCDTVGNKCVNNKIDCFSVASNGGCPLNGAVSSTSVTGMAFYNSATTFPINATSLMPTAAGSRNCDNIACYAGKRSTYYCTSNGDYTYTCSRQVLTCTSSACQDTVCTTLGTWSNGQLDTSCGTTVNRPACNDNNLCTADQCNPSFTGTTCISSGTCETSSGGNRCIFPSNSSSCNDNSVCTYNLCLSATGCSYPSVPLPSNKCLIYTCNSLSGNTSTVNASACSTNIDQCIVTYCDKVSQTCKSFNRSSMATTNTTSYIDADGSTKTVTGCKSAPLGCIKYGCNSLTGQCFTDTSNCSCFNNSDCNDRNGCTSDFCDTVNGVCLYTSYDCYNISSNGACNSTGGSFAATNATSWSLYSGATTFNNGIVNSPFAPGSYNCDQLACLNGQRSSYSCQSTGNYSYICVRSILNDCPKGGCKDTLCKTLGTWTNGKADTDCSPSIDFTCPGDMCNTAQCNTGFVFTYGTTASRCILTSTSSLCVDGNLCTVDGLCNPASGCNYTVQTNTTLTNNTCSLVTCSSNFGWTSQDIGATSCPPTSNLCQIRYCDPLTKACNTVDRASFNVGTSQTFTDSAGNTKTVTGCKNPGNDPLTCKTYGCEPSTGECFTSTSNCNCLNDQSCQDGNGCTVDKCDFIANACTRTAIDCYSQLSNGKCKSGQTYSADTSVGLLIYNGSVPQNNVYTKVDSNGLPKPSTGVDRTCAQLGCYNGQPSQYSCFSIAEGSYVCQRISVNCSRNGCQDNICRTMGTWSGAVPQIDANCGTTYVPNCADENSCTIDYCNTTWVPSSPVKQRCIHQLVDDKVFCDDGNFCTQDYCDKQDTTGNICKHNLYSQAYLRKKICPPTNESTICTTVKCTVNKCIYTGIECLPPTLCQIFLCNASTNGACAVFLTGVYKIDRCGICGGNGLSCIPANPGNPKKTSIIVSLAVGLGVGLGLAALIIGILSRQGYSAYQALAMEIQGTVTVSSTYQGGEDHISNTGELRDS